MLLWISAAGLAGAGWFGWLVWRDYDWSDIQIKGRSSHPTSYSNNPVNQNSRVEDTAFSGPLRVENDLLGSTQTDWSGPNSLTYSENQPFTANLDAELATDEELVAAQEVSLSRKTDEDFVVVGNLEEAHGRIDEDFVAVGKNPLLYNPDQNSAYNTSTVADDDEDFVVVSDEESEGDDDLPEVDVSDYLNQWTPVVPKIAALITHELWPQLRSYLESLPQYGDASLERVVNAVAEDVGVLANETDGVGEEPVSGFAFYANLFEQMEQAEESAELITA